MTPNERVEARAKELDAAYAKSRGTSPTIWNQPISDGLGYEYWKRGLRALARLTFQLERDAAIKYCDSTLSAPEIVADYADLVPKDSGSP